MCDKKVKLEVSDGWTVEVDKSKVVDITFHCENCGYKLAIKKFRITFSDGEICFGCQDCIAEYFAETPEQIVKVEAI